MWDKNKVFPSLCSLKNIGEDFKWNKYFTNDKHTCHWPSLYSTPLDCLKFYKLCSISERIPGLCRKFIKYLLENKRK